MKRKNTDSAPKFKTRGQGNKTEMICQNSVAGGKYWKGETCENWSLVGKTTTSVLCWKCTSVITGPPEVKTSNKSTGRPRGWQFMAEFVDKDGQVYHKGVVQPELKDVKQATVIEPKQRRKLSRKEKAELEQQLLEQVVFHRGQIKKAKFKKDINTSQAAIRKLQQQLNKVK
jgi:hypothetical protein